MQNWKAVLWTVVALGAAGAVAGLAVVYGGLYNLAATVPHTWPVYELLQTAMKNSVQRLARDVVVPPALDTSDRVLSGAACYRERCAQCHGGPGVAAEAIGMAMQPIPGPLVAASRTWRARELYWITSQGIKMSGMPAWQHHMNEAELWSVVAFVRHLPALTPTAYAELMTQARQCRSAEPPPAPAAAGGRVERGRLALHMYGCHGCHTIPGITGPQPLVGPPLAGFARSQLIAGRVANTHTNLVAWIRHPQQMDPRTAMPDQGVTREHAEDMAAYLATLR